MREEARPLGSACDSLTFLSRCDLLRERFGSMHGQRMDDETTPLVYWGDCEFLRPPIANANDINVHSQIESPRLN